MNDDYLDELTKLLEQVSPKLAISHRFEFKNVFGAIGGYVDGRIFSSFARWADDLTSTTTEDKMFPRAVSCYSSRYYWSEKRDDDNHDIGIFSLTGKSSETCNEGSVYGCRTISCVPAFLSGTH